MMVIAIVPDNSQDSPTRFRATAGEAQSSGATVGEALDALRAQLGGPEQTTLVVIQPMRPDELFTAAQQQRLAELVARWRAARGARRRHCVAAPRTSRTGGAGRSRTARRRRALGRPRPPASVMNPHYPLVARRAGHRCEYCHPPEAVFNFPFEVEHVLPTSRGGSDDESNLCLACRACNLRKGDRLVAFDDLTQNDVPLFHPREQRWADHFRVDVESGELQGITPIGRATILGLELNHPLQLAARPLWIRLRMFP